jgi:hypothetical protein
MSIREQNFPPNILFSLYSSKQNTLNVLVPENLGFSGSRLIFSFPIRFCRVQNNFLVPNYFNMKITLELFCGTKYGYMAGDFFYAVFFSSQGGV